MIRDRVFTIAPHAPFLETLADRLFDGTLLPDWPRTGPFWLSDITVILPTARARRAFAEVVARRSGTLLLPDLRVFGGEAEDEEPFLPPYDRTPLPPAVGAITRRLVLGELIAAWVGKREQMPFARPGSVEPPGASEILALADSLGHLIDDLHVEGVPAANIAGVAREELAEKWQQTLDFLDIALKAWPETLGEAGLADAAWLRNERLRQQAEAAGAVYGERPVIAAGSTGSIPATAALLMAISRLPRGAVVLPGLDTTLSASSFKALLDPAKAPHGHPQYGMARLLEQFSAEPSMVDELASPAEHKRTIVVRHALALADETADWSEARGALGDGFLDEAAAGVHILCARSEDEQARAIAIAGVEALAAGRSVGIVVQDRNLARRIAAELQRFDVEVDDSAGTPLFQSRIGRLARTALAVASSGFSAVELMGLLRNANVSLGLERGELTRRADLIEFGLLRGQRPLAGVEGLRASLAANLGGEGRPARRLQRAEADAVSDLLARLEDALGGLERLIAGPPCRAAALARELETAVARLRAVPEGAATMAMTGDEAFAQWVSDITAEDGRGPRISRNGLDGALAGLMAGISVRAQRPAREDIAIWGRIEARLQNRDLLILAGLNEGIWPEVADPGAWMSRSMRMAAGLEPPERDQGRAAHDFELGMGNPQVVLAFSERVGSSPTSPSRLLQRLEAFLGESRAQQMRQRSARWIETARALDDAGAPPAPASRPEPRPPAAIRPRRISVTEIEKLIRSPYDLYARHVLGLRKLDPLGEDPTARERGTLIHDVLGTFVEDGHDPLAPDALDALLGLADVAFAGLDAIADRREIWLHRFRRTAELFLEFERQRAGRVARRWAEIRGRWTFELSGQPFVLHGRADRIDLMTDGRLEIIDFKTGGLPAPVEMKAYLAPQLLAEALLARQGAFEGIAAADTGALTYIKIGLGPEAFDEKPFACPDDTDIATAADEMFRRLQRHISAFLLSDSQPMLPRLFPSVGQRFAGDYDHLSRVAEWSLGEEDEN
ncbi:MAG TPA: double-strand break repair protein AddB [Devosiaceae bacterium]